MRNLIARAIVASAGVSLMLMGFTMTVGLTAIALSAHAAAGPPVDIFDVAVIGTFCFAVGGLWTACGFWVWLWLRPRRVE